MQEASKGRHHDAEPNRPRKRKHECIDVEAAGAEAGINLYMFPVSKCTVGARTVVQCLCESLACLNIKTTSQLSSLDYGCLR